LQAHYGVTYRCLLNCGCNSTSTLSLIMPVRAIASNYKPVSTAAEIRNAKHQQNHDKLLSTSKFSTSLFTTYFDFDAVTG